MSGQIPTGRVAWWNMAGRPKAFSPNTLPQTFPVGLT